MNTAARQAFENSGDVTSPHLAAPVRSDEKRLILAKRFGAANGYVVRSGGWIYHFGGRPIVQGWTAFYNLYWREIEAWNAELVSEPTGLLGELLAPEIYAIAERLVEAGARALAAAQITKLPAIAARLRGLERAYYRALSITLEAAQQANPRVLANRLIRERFNAATRTIECELKRAAVLE